MENQNSKKSIKVNGNDVQIDINDIMSEGLKMDILDRLFFLLRKLSAYKLEKRENNSVSEEITNLIVQTISKARRIYRIEHWEQIYFNNQPLLLNDPKLLSASLFIMSLDEWKSQFEKDIKHSNFKGTDARSIRDMIKTCFELGLERSSYNEFFSYYSNSSINHNRINRWIYDEFEIYKEVIDQDYSIVTIKEALKRSKNKSPLYLSNELSQKALKLAMETFWTEYMSKDYYNPFFKVFIQQCTVYKKSVPESFYIKEVLEFQEHKLNLTIEELSDFVGLLKFLSNESIILNLNANRLYNTLIQSFPDIKLLIGNVSFRNNLYKKSDFSNEIKYDLKTILDKLINK